MLYTQYALRATHDESAFQRPLPFAAETCNACDKRDMRLVTMNLDMRHVTMNLVGFRLLAESD